MGQVVLPALAAGIGERRALGAGLFEYSTEPVDPGSRGMGGRRPDGPLVRCRAQPEFISAKARYSIDKAVVGESPSFVEARDTHGPATLAVGGRSSSWRP